MKNHSSIRTFLVLCVLAFISSCTTNPSTPTETLNTYDQLASFFTDWREFQSPELIEGVPDYSVDVMKKQHADLTTWKNRLDAFDTTGWPVKHQIDWYLVWAEMNGLDFDHRVIQPWVRDPAFYVWFYSYPSDVPEREGPNIFGAIELPAYKQPLSEADAKEIASRLRNASALFEQAKINLTGNARDLWVTGIRSIRDQSIDLNNFAKVIESAHPDLAAAANEAIAASDQFADWLEEQAPKKTGPSGVGKENYSWYIRNVHLVPYSWEGEKILLERELARSHSALRFTEHQNRNLPKLEKANTPESYTKLITDGVNEYMDFLETEEFLTVKTYMKPAMMAQVQNFVPTDKLRGFFDEVDYRDPMPMRAHHFHWIEKERELVEPVESPIRRIPLLYNIFDSRAEGLATAMEELVMNAGLLENRPRAKELVHIMLAMRAARGLGGLYQHGLDMTFDEATQYASKWVPWGLVPADGATIQGEEQFYLQQPGYGSSYVIGKLDIDKLIAEYARQREGKFNLKEFMDEFNKVGIIPVSLVYWEMTGSKSMLNEAKQ
ncbi:MAG: DUF885 domain-containing protein [Cyclobacteriaceae bacterium]|nr:DUF885 domain-containing protein [Cyclobacteriaceae bacterium]